MSMVSAAVPITATVIRFRPPGRLAACSRGTRARNTTAMVSTSPAAATHISGM